MAISFGSSGMPSYITDVINSRAKNTNPWNVGSSKPSPTTSTSIRDRVNQAMQQDKKASQPIIKNAQLPSFIRDSSRDNVKKVTESELDSALSGFSDGRYNPNPNMSTGPEPVIIGNTGDITNTNPFPAGSSGGSTGGGGGSAGGGGGGTAAPAAPAAANIDPEDTEAYLQSLQIAELEFQKDRADELRRLRNMETELFGTGGTVEQTEFDQGQARRRLAAQMAGRGTLQGGAYAGAERGLGTIQQRNQDYSMQNLTRPFSQMTETDRLFDSGIGFTPSEGGQGGLFSMLGGDFDFTQTDRGRIAAAQARQLAMNQLLAGLTGV